MHHKTSYHAVHARHGSSIQCGACHNQFMFISFTGIDEITMGEIMGSALTVSLFQEHLTECTGAPECQGRNTCQSLGAYTTPLFYVRILGGQCALYKHSNNARYPTLETRYKLKIIFPYHGITFILSSRLGASRGVQFNYAYWHSICYAIKYLTRVV